MKSYFKWLAKQEDEGGYGAITSFSLIYSLIFYVAAVMFTALPIQDASKAAWKLEQQCYEVPGRTFLYKKTSGKSKGSRHLVTYKCKDGFYQTTHRSYDY